jgi:ribonuclease Z
MKKTHIVVLVLLFLGLVIYSQRGSIALALMERAAPAMMAADKTKELPDGLHIALCGAGSPLPDPKRSGPCVLVLAGQQLFVVDSGSGGTDNINVMQYPVGELKGVFLTHFHSDHIDGLGQLATMRWVNGNNTEPLPVRGPDGVEDIVAGFNQAYARDSIYRNDHHGDSVAPLSGHGMIAEGFPVPEAGQAVTVFTSGSLRVEMFSVDHEPISPAVGYRFTYKDRVAVISGDTSKSSNLQLFSENADLLVHEALARNIVGIMNRMATQTGRTEMAKITADILDYHASPVEAAETARDAKVGHLLFYHIVPGLILPGLEAAWLDGVDDVFDDYTLGEDGTTISLPAGSKDIQVIAEGL